MLAGGREGKIEILAVDERHIYLRYHRAKDQAMCGKFMIYHRDDQAYWLDQLEVISGPESALDSSTGPASSDRWHWE